MIRSILTSCLLCYSIFISGQNITGDWQGSMEVQGMEIPIVFHIVKDNTGKFSASFDSPKQNAYDLACNDVILNADSIILVMQIIKGNYTGKINSGNNLIEGTWNQGGVSLPLNIHKTSEFVAIKKINRPQTPKPPYPYKSEDVIYFNKDKSIQFGATFTVPLPDSGVNYFRAPVYPAVILITGSGKQDRDETIFNHKPFAVIADYLTRQGIAVLRIDDRDMGKTTGDFSKSTTADFANDVEAGIDYLKSREDVDIENIGLIGHSEGGMIAPIVAARRKDVRFIVLLAGPGIKISELMLDQNIDLLASKGVIKKDLDQFRDLYKGLLNVITTEKDTSKAKQSALEVFKDWKKTKSDSTVKNTTGVVDEKSMITYTESLVTEFNKPWFSYFIRFNPAEYLNKISCPVLALNGEKDIQVAAKPNLDAIKKALEKHNNKKFKLQIRPGLNHLFQHCNTCTIDEYAELEETFDTGTLKIISDWIKTERFN